MSLLQTLINTELPVSKSQESPERIEQDTNNPEDIIAVDVPLFIRLLEWAKEEAKTDAELHELSERISARLNIVQQPLTMNDYGHLVYADSSNQTMNGDEVDDQVTHTIELQ